MHEARPDVDAEISELCDRERIRDCLARLARGEDRRNAELVSGAFWPSATVDLGIFRGSFDDYLAWVVPGASEIPVTQHVLGQSLIELRADCAIAETHVQAYHRVAGENGHRDTVIGGRYADRFEKNDGQWRIAERTMLYDWCRDLGEAVDWSQGLMGLPFDSARYAGRAHGDPSERILGDGRAGDQGDVAE